MTAKWRAVKLGQVCTLINGRAYSQSELLSAGKYRVLRVGNFFTNEHWYYSDFELEENKYCEGGDLLYAWSASFGPRIWSGEKVIFHYHIWKVVPDLAVIDQKFLFMFFLWDKEHIQQDRGTGTTMMHVSKGAMESRDILLPTLSEQRDIVNKLDALLGRAKTAREELARIPRLVERYKRAILVKALKGHITADWRDAPVQAHEWEEKSLGEIAEIGTGATPKRGELRFYQNGTIPWITSAAVNKARIDTADEFITEAALRETNCKVFPAETLLIAMYGEGQTRGRVAVLGLSAATNQALAAIRIRNCGEVSAGFVYWFLRANYLDLRRQAAGGVQPNLNLGIIKATRIRLPPIEQQHKIVSAIREAIARIDSLLACATRASDLLVRLDQAVLSKAFEGGLLR